MSVAAPERAAPPPTAPRSHQLTGTRGLVRLALRADRFRIGIWAVAVAWLMLVSVQSFDRLYPTPEARAARAELISAPAATALAGPGYGLDDYTLGAMTANELALWVMIPVAIMAVLAVTRHLRGPEEDGRLELVRSQPVGRDAPVVAGLVAAAVATVAVGLATFLGLLTTSLDPAGSALMCASIVVVGLVFAGTSAVASQVAGQARAASALGMAAVGVAVVLRGIGDVRGPESTSVLTWLSPFGWSQATAPYTLDRWWPLLVGLAATGLCVVASFALAARRDLGTGLLPERLGPTTGRLRGLAGLTWRRQRTSLVSWAAAIVLSGVLVGVLSSAVVDFVEDDPDLGDLFPTGPAGAVAAVFTLYVVFLAVMAAAGAVTVVSAARAEESGGRAEALLALPVARARWLGVPVAVGALAMAAAMLVAGLLMGLAASANLDDPDQLGDLLVACAVTLPGVWCVLGVAVLVMGFAPRLLGLVWGYVSYVGIVAVLGGVLPDGSDVASPFAYLPAMPSEEMDWPAVLGVTAAALVLVVVGLTGMRRRDVSA